MTTKPELSAVDAELPELSNEFIVSAADEAKIPSGFRAELILGIGCNVWLQKFAAVVARQAIASALAKHSEAYTPPECMNFTTQREEDYSHEINRLRNVIQAACIGGLDAMIGTWKRLFPDAPVPTITGSNFANLLYRPS